MNALERDKEAIDIQNAVYQIYREANYRQEDIASSLAELTGLAMFSLNKSKLNLSSDLFEIDVLINKDNNNETLHTNDY
ncbi:MAG: hypothetical protein GY941_26295 [Planctomycetes bacterium]|nr:hypothetical protein [Planctomycetota bacterium]